MRREYLRLTDNDITLGKVIGENDEGLTLFIPKDLQGKFHLEGGDTFLSVTFVKTDGDGGVMPWCPWADGPVLKEAP